MSCQVAGCTDQARWHAFARVPAKEDATRCITFDPSMSFCDKHRDKAPSPATFLSADVREQLVQAFTYFQLGAPDFDAASLQFTEIMPGAGPQPALMPASIDGTLLGTWDVYRTLCLPPQTPPDVQAALFNTWISGAGSALQVWKLMLERDPAEQRAVVTRLLDEAQRIALTNQPRPPGRAN